MSLKDLLAQWDKENPAKELTLNTETIRAALGDPRVMGTIIAQKSMDQLSDITKTLTQRFGGERDITVNFQDVAAAIEFMHISPQLKKAIKDSLLDIG